MAVTLEAGAIKRFRGLSTDEKPGVGEAFGVGSTFTELDTGDRYIWRGEGEPWVRQTQTIETMFAELMDINSEILAEVRTLRAAVATIANGQWDTEYPTDR